jgi:hypothetical protein
MNQKKIMNYLSLSEQTNTRTINKQTNITQTQKGRSPTRPQGNTHQGIWEVSELLKSAQ